ncbi:inositol monophosphatase [Mycetocola tolaasinivorans]|uniref:Inositol-1-monophosphatase n=1 Tax=Mycetocola tolaasinivorans TaxID=76635 RepID=A0A3L7A5X6_9MICO|nr:inositol monophosphatase family protein [Mycetocola tolaasinivorans]RLP75726.1 inositol monophosphatase [Mycetocola tolaasinivorans]
MSTRELQDLARDIAVEAAALARARREEGVLIAQSKSSPEDIVTAADREVEAFVRSRLAELRPADGFFGEEGGAETGSSGLTWVVDPIDGTVNYAYGIPNYAVSVAVVEGEADPHTWTGLAGAVANPASGETYSAARGEGATLNGRTLHRGDVHVDLNLALVATGFSYSAERRMWQTGIMQQMMGRVRDYRRMGAASLDGVGVAAGYTDVYYEVGTKPWDHAAATIIAREAGIRVEGIRGAAPGAELVLSALPSLFDEVHDLLIEFGIEG